MTRWTHLQHVQTAGTYLLLHPYRVVVRLFFALQVKRTAPVTGKLRRAEFDVVEFARSLEGAGVAAIAVNTDPKFFGCSYEDLTSIRVSDPVCASEEERTRTL